MIEAKIDLKCQTCFFEKYQA